MRTPAELAGGNTEIQEHSVVVFGSDPALIFPYFTLEQPQTASFLASVRWPREVKYTASVLFSQLKI